MTKLEEAVTKAIAATGGKDRDAVLAYAMELQESDPELREEVRQLAVRHILEQIAQEVIDEGFAPDNPQAMANEVLKRLRRAHLKVVR